MADAKKEAGSTVVFMGKECSVTLKSSDNSEKVQMKKGDYDSLLDSFGVTKEVRDAVKAADDKIIKAAAEFQQQRLLTANKGKKESDKGYVTKSVLQLGQGHGALEFEMIPHRSHKGVDPQTHEPKVTEKFGIFRVTKYADIARELRAEGALIDQIEESFKKAYKK